MKKLILFAGLLCMAFLSAQAKDDKPKEEKLESSEKKNIEGVLVKKNGKTQKAKLVLTIGKFDNAIDMEEVQRGVTYVDADSSKKVVAPEEISEVRFTYDSTEYRMLSCPNKIKLGGGAFKAPKFIYLKLEQDGNLRLLRYYESTVSTSPTGKEMKTVTRRYVLRKSNDEMIKPESEDFKKDMSKFFEDCQAMVFKISKNEFTKKDMVKMVRFYNAECK